MSLFDIFTGAPAKKAAEQTRAYLGGVQNAGNQAVDTGYNLGTGFVQTGAGQARNDLTQGFAGATGAIGAGTNQALGYLDAGNTAALGRLDNAAGVYAPLSAKYGAGTDLYLNSLGVNGAAGNGAALSAFQAGPGYGFQLDQGLDAINRRRNAAGMLNSGNADRDAQVYGQGLANQEYGNWQNRLAGLVSPELAAAQGQAGIDTTAAGLINSGGVAKAGVAGAAGNSLADILARQGTSLGGLASGEGNTLAGLASTAAGQKVGLGTGLAQPYANTYNQEANAQMAGSQNFWGLGLGLANIGGGLLGKYLGGQPINNYFSKG